MARRTPFALGLLAACSAGCASLAPRTTETTQAPQHFHAGNALPTNADKAPTAIATPEKTVANPEALLESQVKLAAHHTAGGEFAPAKAYLDKALAAAPRNIPALVQLAKWHLAQDQEPQARAALQQALAIDPRAALAWNEVAILRSKAGDYPGAVEALAKALERNPQHPLYLENLGAVYLLAGDHEAAHSAYAQAFGPAESRYRIAGAMYSRGDRAGAYKQLSAGAAERPNHAPTLRMLAALDAEIAGGNHRQ